MAPPAKSSLITIQPKPIPTTSTTTTATPATAQKKISSTDYRAWDKFDVDTYEGGTIQQERSHVSAAPSKLPSNVQKRIGELKQTHSNIALERLAEQERLKGNECMKAKEYAEAVQFYTRCLELSPDDTSLLHVYANRSLAHLKMQMYDPCMEDAGRVLDADPTNAKARLRRGLALHQCGRYQEAMKDFEKVLELDGECLEAQRYWEASKKKFDEVGGILEATKPVETAVHRMAIAEEDPADSDISSDEEEEDDRKAMVCEL